MRYVFTPEGIYLGLPFYVNDALERRNRTGSKDTLPVLKLLTEFIEEKLNRTIIDTDMKFAARALRDLHAALGYLVRTGNPEFESLHQDIRAGMTKLHTTARNEIVRRFLESKDPDQVGELSAALVKMIERGQWPNWQREFDQLINQSVADRQCKRAS